MTKKALLAILGLLAIVMAVAIVLLQDSFNSKEPNENLSARHATPNAQESPRLATQVPAHFETAPEPGSLASTLPPEKFTGQTRLAYHAVREIPQTIAQMPCYCYCDRGMGHKSLHSCFEDDHAAHCAVCTDEALMAYKLQREGLNPREIRERIMAKYSQP